MARQARILIYTKHLGMLAAILVAAAVLLVMTDVVYSTATRVCHKSGPTSVSPYDVYTFTACSDAGSGEAVCIGWTTSPGGGSGINQCAGPGESCATCGLPGDTEQWYGNVFTCTIPGPIKSQTVNYQFSVHQGNCAGSTVVAGDSGSFNTGPNAISFLSLDAHNAGVSSLGWLIPVVAGIVAASLAGLGVLWRRRQL